MNTAKTKLLIWLRFAWLFLFIFSVVNAKRSCRGLLKNVKLPAHTNIAAKQRKANRITLVCDNGYHFSKGENTRDLLCWILKRLSGRIRIPQCKDYSDFSECGNSPFKPFDARARIIGGEIVDVEKWPWIVRILVRGKQVCGGTLLNQEFVLTSAHCFEMEGRQLNDVKVSLRGKNHSCLKLHIHHSYNARNFKNDIALIKIPKLQHFTRNQRAICLPHEINMTNIIKDGKEIYAIGWGRTTPVKPDKLSDLLHLSKDLKQIKLPFKANNFCENDVKNKTAKELKRRKDIWYFNSTTQFCAGDVNGQIDTCHGDSGGPAMVFHVDPVSRKWRWFQVGIVSWGVGCAQKGEVGYYTKVSAYLGWISQIAQPSLTLTYRNNRNKLNLKYKGAGLDLIFVLDTSSSVTRRYLGIAKTFMRKLAERLGVDERANGDGTHIACVNYGARPRLEFLFNDAPLQRKETILKRIEKIKNMGGVTDTRLALDVVRHLILPSSKRPNSTKALFLITDGESHPGGSSEKAASILKKDVEIYVIRIGKNIRGDSFRKLASKNHSVFKIRSNSDVRKLLKILVTTPVRAVSTTPMTRTVVQQGTTLATVNFRTTIASNSLCSNPVLPLNSRVRFFRNNVVLLRCKEDYLTIAAGILLCSRNKWRSIKGLSCVAKSCPNPGSPRNGQKHGSSYFVGDVVRFTCNDCYTLIGHSRSTCLKNRSWSFPQPLCVLITCPPLQDTNQATVSYSSRTCNAAATYTCKDGLIVVGSGKRICKKTGEWEGAEPQCITPNSNIALRKPASISSHWALYGGPASAAVDGNRGGIFAQTRYESRAWLKIDLLRQDSVSTVIVVNRRDCCITKIDGFKVSVGNNGANAEANAECGGRSKAKEGENIIQCPRTLRGRYVFVYMTRYTAMVLREVEVYRRRKTE